MTRQPDYPALIALLPTLHRLVDAGGTVILEPHEADRITALGFPAQSGTWSVPNLPAALVAGNPLLEPLGDDVDRFWKPRSLATVEAAQVTIIRKHGAEIPAVAEVGTPGEGDQDRSLSSTASLFDSPRFRTLFDQCAVRAPEKECTSVLAAVERAGGCIPKRLLQKKLWRIPADRLNQVIRSLVEQDSIRVEGNILIASQKNENPTAVTGGGGI